MNDGQMNLFAPDKRLAAICGLFCPACTLFIGTSEDPDRLNASAARLQRQIEEIQCYGCRSEKRCFFCHENCKMAKCAAEKGIEFCGQCDEYPCSELKLFQSQMPHRIELWKSQARIKEVGVEKWYAEMVEHYSCPECRTINSAYDIVCRKCGTTPSCSYVSLHKDQIVQDLIKITALASKE